MKNEVSGMSIRRPRVSFGIPVCNGEMTIRKTLDSLLAQTFSGFEVVICDNASDDRTGRICLDLARRDDRVRYHRHESNIGQIANFNRVFELSSGEYFRWIGCNDWLAPEYLERCVPALDAHSSAVLVTTYQRHCDELGQWQYAEYQGPRVDSPLPHRRFARMLRFFRLSRYYLDPIYSLIRRSALQQTGMLPMMLGTDLVLSAELSLLGPFVHVPECLSYRIHTPPAPYDQVLHRYDPRQRSARWWFARMCRQMIRVMRSKPLPILGQGLCLLSLADYAARHHTWSCYRHGRRFAGTLADRTGIARVIVPRCRQVI